MDPITTAIVAALAAGVIGGVTQIGEHVITDAYEALKAALKNKYGADSDLAQAVDSLEKKPDSSARQEVLAEEVATVQAAAELLNGADPARYARPGAAFAPTARRSLGGGSSRAPIGRTLRLPPYRDGHGDNPECSKKQVVGWGFAAVPTSP